MVEQDLDQAYNLASLAVRQPNLLRQQAWILMQKIVWQQKGQQIDLSQAAQKDYSDGFILYPKKQYFQALPLLESAARAGHAGALYQIGMAYLDGNGVAQNYANASRFLQEAALRGSWDALQALFTRMIGSVTMLPFKLCAQLSKMPQCENVYQAGLENWLTQLRSKQPSRVRPFCTDASNAMLQAMEIRKNPKRMSVPSGEKSHLIDTQGNWEAGECFLQAGAFGDADGFCGYAEILNQSSDPKSREQAVYYYKLAAYLGHSYAMYRLGQHYEAKDQQAARACYRAAAKWGYQPAQMWCRQYGQDF